MVIGCESLQTDGRMYDTWTNPLLPPLLPLLASIAYEPGMSSETTKWGHCVIESLGRKKLKRQRLTDNINIVVHRLRVPLLPHSCYMALQSHPPRLDYSNYIWRRVQIMKLFDMQLHIYEYIYNCISNIGMLIYIGACIGRWWESQGEGEH
jgi:hypothetical protein